MRILTSTTLAIGLVPGLLVLPVVSLPEAAAVPVEPEFQILEPKGVDTTALEDLTVGDEVVPPPIEPGAPAGATTPTGGEPVVLTPPVGTEDFTVAGVTWDPDSTADGITVSMRVREEGVWSDWEALGVTDEGPDAGTDEYRNSRVGTGPLLTDGADGVQVRVDITNQEAPEGLEIALIDAGKSPADDHVGGDGPAASADATGVQPDIITRAEWGADESLVNGEHRINSTIKALVLHHTAGSNSYSRAEAVQELRGIYAYHTKVQGWADIGYNMLVDRYGRIYEGRRGSISEAVQGAHAGGFNTDTYGVSVMGDFDVAGAPQAAIDAVKRVTAWKMGQYGVDPTGTATLVSAGGGTSRYPAGTVVTVNALSGHRDVGQTACPGRYLYPKLGEIRSYAASVVPEPPPPVPSLTAFPRDWNGDGDADMMARDSSARLWSYRGNGTGGFEPRAQIGKGWGSRDLVTQAGDWDGDGDGDVIGRDVRLGNLWLYPGDGRGGWEPPRNIGGNWRVVDALIGPGDFDGDGAVDLVARRRDDGTLWLYPGNGKGGWGTPRQIGHGWQSMEMLVAADDFDGDGEPDIIARTPSGDLRLYGGNGRGGFVGSDTIGVRWGAISSLVVAGNWDSRGGSDLLARAGDGVLYLYTGSGHGSISGKQRIGHGWSSYMMIG